MLYCCCLSGSFDNMLHINRAGGELPAEWQAGAHWFYKSHIKGIEVDDGKPFYNIVPKAVGGDDVQTDFKGQPKA